MLGGGEHQKGFGPLVSLPVCAISRREVSVSSASTTTAPTGNTALEKALSLSLYMFWGSRSVDASGCVVCKDIGDKLQLKFKHVRDAFKPLNLQRPPAESSLRVRFFSTGSYPDGEPDRIHNSPSPQLRRRAGTFDVHRTTWGSMRAHIDL